MRHRMKMEALTAGAGFSGKLDAIDRFFDGGPQEMDEEDYAALKAELGIA